MARAVKLLYKMLKIISKQPEAIQISCAVKQKENVHTICTKMLKDD